MNFEFDEADYFNMNAVIPDHQARYNFAGFLIAQGLVDIGNEHFQAKKGRVRFIMRDFIDGF